jgi:hypothetical protein
VVAGEETIAAIEAIGAVPGERGMNKPARAVKIERVEVLQPVAADPPDVPEEPEPLPVPESASGS